MCQICSGRAFEEQSQQLLAFCATKKIIRYISQPYKMAKKRKASSQGQRSGPREFDPADGKLGPISTYEDVANSEDEFHINRDKIMLDDGPEAKRRRKLEDGVYYIF